MDLIDGVSAATLAGAVLIGLACGLLTVLTGRVMSASAMIGSLLGGAEGVAATSITFIAGLLFAALLLSGLGLAPPAAAEAGWPFLASGGLLVGAAARAGGASLGGAVTGATRRSGRAAATLLLIASGAAAGAVLRAMLAGGAAV